jgi:hypothetical protein
VKDFNLGINITFYGRTFRIVSCDKFTEVCPIFHSLVSLKEY